MAVSRRRFLQKSLAGSAVGVSTLPLFACGSTNNGASGRITGETEDSANPFKHSVASGDPTQDSVVLWTRVTQVDEDQQTALGSVLVNWAVYEDAELTRLVKSGVTQAANEHDYCVKVDVKGLSAYSAYYYQFTGLGFSSPVGRFQTLPVWDANTRQRFRVAVLSCASYSQGYFHVYKEIADRNDIDLVIHVGDYLYEYGDNRYGGSRLQDPPHEAVSLNDYRRRHALYKADTDLAELHRQYAFVTIWDDHEFADNAYACGAHNHSEADQPELNPGDEGYNEGYWAERKKSAIQAYFEWMPIRPSSDDVTQPGQLFDPRKGQVWRSFSVGEFADIILIDARIWEREKGTRTSGFTADSVRYYQSSESGCTDESLDRELLGDTQEDWLHEQLTDSTAKWKIVGNQVMVSHLRASRGEQVGQPRYLGGDSWDAYPATQEGLYQTIHGSSVAGGGSLSGQGVDNIVFLSGDAHSSWAFDVVGDPDADQQDALAVEFVVPSVTSPGFEASAEAIAGVMENNPHLKYVNGDQHGWLLLDLTSDYATAEWYHIGSDPVVNSINRPGASGLAHVCRASATPSSNGIEVNPQDPTGVASQRTHLSADYLNSRPRKAP